MVFSGRQHLLLGIKEDFHKERTNINPATKEKQTIPETTVPAFKPGKAFKDAVK